MMSGTGDFHIPADAHSWVDADARSSVDATARSSVDADARSLVDADTHSSVDASARSWVDSANDPACDFPIQNLPFGIFSGPGEVPPRAGVAIGDRVLDLAVLAEASLLPVGADVFAQPSLNRFMSCGRDVWRATRGALAGLLSRDNPVLRDDPALRARALLPQSETIMHLPAEIAGFTDFYASRHHAFNAGALLRGPERALLPNWSELPVGYNGRASSVVVSGTPVRRPHGQIRRPDAARPELARTERLDFELELGALVGVPTAMGETVSVADAESHIFGLVLLNDWSARDVQAWEAQPLGPFTAKIFATSISPWVVLMDALALFRCDQPAQDPVPLDYLRPCGAQGCDITLEVDVRPDGARTASTIVRTNFRHMYWSVAQQVAHHTVGGCNLRVGDLLGSGTVSGPTPHSCGCLLEQTLGGTRPVSLSDRVSRCYLEDGDTVVLRGWCQGDGYRVGFGACAGRVFS